MKFSKWTMLVAIARDGKKWGKPVAVRPEEQKKQKIRQRDGLGPPIRNEDQQRNALLSGGDGLGSVRGYHSPGGISLRRTPVAGGGSGLLFLIPLNR